VKAPAHLAHLATDRAGRPVPYINCIGTNTDPARWRVRYDRTIGRVAAWHDDQPGGEPNFLRQSIQRQRECMYSGLCQVCARPVPWPDRRLVVSTVSVQTIDWDRGFARVFTEPWLCPDCAAFATAVCPALIRRRSAGDFRLIEAGDPAGIQLVVSSGWIEGPYEAATRAAPVAMWVKAMLSPESVR
jgi:hypothetical protein